MVVNFGLMFRMKNLWDTYLEGNGLHNVVGTSGDLSWRSWHDRKQYGGVDAQREVVRMIGRSLGLSYPNGEPWSETYTTNNTVISHTLSEPNENLGHTFFFTDDDQTALKTIFGSKSSDALTGQRFDHRQRIEEDLRSHFQNQRLGRLDDGRPKSSTEPDLDKERLPHARQSPKGVRGRQAAS